MQLWCKLACCKLHCSRGCLGHDIRGLPLGRRLGVKGPLCFLQPALGQQRQRGVKLMRAAHTSTKTRSWTSIDMWKIYTLQGHSKKHTPLFERLT